jgi:hypothetical protein
MMKMFAAVLLLMAALPCAAVECLEPGPDTVPVLVIQSMDIRIDGVSEDEAVTALRERLLAGGKYRVALPDQYRYAVQNNRVDRCTPSFGLHLQIGMNRSDPGAAFGLGGFVTRHEFVAKADVNLLPDTVTLDSFTLRDKADAVVSGKKVAQAFERVFESVAKELESRRDGWMSSKVPGF